MDASPRGPNQPKGRRQNNCLVLSTLFLFQVVIAISSGRNGTFVEPRLSRSTETRAILDGDLEMWTRPSSESSFGVSRQATPTVVATTRWTAQFDRKGLWSLRSVWFSKYGTLLATKALVAACEAGYYVDELAWCRLTSVETGPREKIGARAGVRPISVSGHRCEHAQATAARQVHEASPSTLGWVGGVRVLPVELKAAIVLF